MLDLEVDFLTAVTESRAAAQLDHERGEELGFYIDMINVGQGDAFLLSVDFQGRDFNMLIDGGARDKGDCVADFVIEYCGGELDAVVGTHLDGDHIGGLIRVVERCSVRQFFLNLPDDPSRIRTTLVRQRLFEGKKASADWDAITRSLETGRELSESLGKAGLSAQRIVAGDWWDLGDVALKVLNPTPSRLSELWEDLEGEESRMLIRRVLRGQEIAPATSAENDSSVVMELVYKNEPYALFTADAGASLLREVTEGRSYHFLKVPHHGSKTGLDDALIAQLSPGVAFVPVGKNSFGHPAVEILDMLRAGGAETYCSEKTVDCRKECRPGGFGNVCHRKDRPVRNGWVVCDTAACKNNPRAKAASA